MKWVREPDGFYTETLLGLSIDEVKTLQVYVKRAIPGVQRLYDKYRDLHESGYGTERHADLMFKYEEILGTLKGFVNQ